MAELWDKGILNGYISRLEHSDVAVFAVYEDKFRALRILMQSYDPGGSRAQAKSVNEKGVPAVAITGNSPDIEQLLTNLGQNKYRVGLVGPEMALSTQFHAKVLNQETFTRNVICLVIDELHSRTGDVARRGGGREIGAVDAELGTQWGAQRGGGSRLWERRRGRGGPGAVLGSGGSGGWVPLTLRWGWMRSSEVRRWWWSFGKGNVVQ
ncbi:hypothetical protein B0H16DRAFT_1699488 [Mycena metata]|nr:hypothetical protein B0H16DRAFT_1699488 [Mycena metata]